ncbi:ABC transporter permease [Nocardioides sp.]|uniref:ABC transporter permease n=1 Tax=Nocardioides sp. TaxID=35761 RepID=UPI000C8BCB31|nr:ABC transporter permease [Nocardioides sp.]MAS54654.1 peptide ABC transporter permease [Pimelobacter sp.]MDE0776340.1 ABC transporter permease [Nocardioides sp.]
MSSGLSVDAVDGPGGEEKPPEDPEAPQQLAGRSPTRIALGRLARDKVAVVGTVVLLILVVLAIMAPLICDWWNIYPDQKDPNAPTPSQMLDGNQLPSFGPPQYPFTWDHPLGIEPQSGRDNLALLLYGLRTSLTVALLATVFSTVVGVTLGLLAGYAKGAVDAVLSFVIDFFLSFPFILGALALAPIITSRFGGDQDTLRRAELLSLVGILVLFGWMGLARLIRGQVLSLREREFVQAAQVIGVPTWQILFKELLPNLVAPIVVAISLSIPAYVAAEAGLSFLGIGLTESPSLGKTVNSAVNYFERYPLYLWTPVVTIMIMVIALNLVGDSIRDAFDPKTRR